MRSPLIWLQDQIARPPRFNYNPDRDLPGPVLHFDGDEYFRNDISPINLKDQRIECSHYLPAVRPDYELPCVIYCHSNSGGRPEANDVVLALLPKGISVFVLDFTGSGLSEGEHVTLGLSEAQDLMVVVEFLRLIPWIGRIAIWGRSMGAVATLLYASCDPSINCIILDSPYSRLSDLLCELAASNFRLSSNLTASLTKKIAKILMKTYKWDISKNNALTAAEKCKMPALFGHAQGDTLVGCHHSSNLHAAYQGTKQMIWVNGDHWSDRLNTPFFPSAVYFILSTIRQQTMTKVLPTSLQRFDSWNRDANPTRPSTNDMAEAEPSDHDAAWSPSSDHAAKVEPSTKWHVITEPSTIHDAAVQPSADQDAAPEPSIHHHATAKFSTNHSVAAGPSTNYTAGAGLFTNHIAINHNGSVELFNADGSWTSSHNGSVGIFNEVSTSTGLSAENNDLSGPSSSQTVFSASVNAKDTATGPCTSPVASSTRQMASTRPSNGEATGMDDTGISAPNDNRAISKLISVRNNSDDPKIIPHTVAKMPVDHSTSFIPGISPDSVAVLSSNHHTSVVTNISSNTVAPLSSNLNTSIIEGISPDRMAALSSNHCALGIEGISLESMAAVSSIDCTSDGHNKSSSSNIPGASLGQISELSDVRCPTADPSTYPLVRKDETHVEESERRNVFDFDGINDLQQTLTDEDSLGDALINLLRRERYASASSSSTSDCNERFLGSRATREMSETSFADWQLSGGDFAGPTTSSDLDRHLDRPSSECVASDLEEYLPAPTSRSIEENKHSQPKKSTERDLNGYKEESDQPKHDIGRELDRGVRIQMLHPWLASRYMDTEW